MATVVLRLIKGTPLTIQEIDDNYNNLNNDKAEVNEPSFTGGFIGLPPGTTAERPVTPVQGMIRYNTETDNIEGYINGDWRDVGLTLDSSGYGTGKIKSLYEKVNVVAAGGTGTVDVDIKTATVWYYTANNSANWTFNFRGDGSTTLDSILAIGESITVAFMTTNGATGYRPTGHTIDGAAATVKWQGSAPTAGNANAIDTWAYTIIKTAAATFTVLGSQTKYV